MVTEVRPEIEPGTVDVAMGVLGRSLDAISRFVTSLETSGAFIGVLNRQVELTEDGMYRAVLRGRYLESAAPLDAAGGGSGEGGPPGNAAGGGAGDGRLRRRARRPGVFAVERRGLLAGSVGRQSEPKATISGLGARAAGLDDLRPPRLQAEP